MKKNLEVIHPNAAGIDIGARQFFVDAGEDDIRIFNTFTDECNALRDYLISHHISTVAMEATGVYWVVLYSVLEEAGIEVYLVNGRDVKNLPGRKSDVKDCQWLRQLHSYGLLRKSFIPDSDIRIVRSYLRLRQDHIRAAATQTHLMQKALTQMNVRLAEVINDITGVSGLRMIRAILAGERDPQRLLELCVDQIRTKKGELVLKALQGHYRAEHLFALGQALRTWEHYHTLIAECDRLIETQLQHMTKDKDDPGGQRVSQRKPVRYHKPDIDNLHVPLLKLSSGNDPTGIAGITDYSFLQIMSEVGTDLSRWPTEKHFTSWLKLAPMRASSGQMSRRVTMKRHNAAGQLFRQLGQGLLNSRHLALGSFGRRIRAKRGGGVAIKAIARKIAEAYYRVMTKGAAYVERGIEAYEKQLEQRRVEQLKRLAVKHNMQLVPVCP